MGSSAGFARALLLDSRGRVAEAEAAYLALLRDVPGHAGALNNLGALLNRTGRRSAARLCYAEAARLHPGEAAGHVNLAHLLHREGAVEEARLHYDAALGIDAELAEAHRGLANLLEDCGEAAAAALHRERGWRGRALVHLPYRGEGRPIRVLLVISAVGGNIATAPLLDEGMFEVFVLAAEFFAPAMELPAHDLVINGIGDADGCAEALAVLPAIVARSGRQVINDPARVRASGRLEVARLLADIPGLRAPRMALFARAGLDAAALAARGFSFPLLLRAPGFHTGRHFLCVRDAGALAGAVASLPGEAVLAIAFFDARGADGRFRKYRVMVIGGALYPLHFAISPEWKVHYFSAAMAEEAAHRDEEARFLADMAGVLGPRAMAALGEACARLGLDYGGVDFALDAAGEVLVFEANAAMAVVAPDGDPRWDYRRAAIGAVVGAARRMFTERAMGASAERRCAPPKPH
jgi:glutathione synthase/RimK-type ligase-like ATP-grasp enzyme